MHEGNAASDVVAPPMPATTVELVPDDILKAAALSQAALAPLLDADWEQPIDGLTWSRRRTLQHIANALDWYTLLLADPSSDQFLSLGLRYVEQSIAEILAVVQRRALVFGAIAAVAAPGARGYHYWGRPDSSGYLAMGCAEILLHTEDIVQSFDQGFSGPDDLSRRIVARLFPWTPAAPAVDGWSLLRWATGRLELPAHGRVAPDWTWHAPPLAEWDGEIKTRASWTVPARPPSRLTTG
jgi:hypothetical protein